MIRFTAAELRPLDSARSGAEIRAISAEVRKDLSEKARPRGARTLSLQLRCDRRPDDKNGGLNPGAVRGDARTLSVHFRSTLVNAQAGARSPRNAVICRVTFGASERSIRAVECFEVAGDVLALTRRRPVRSKGATTKKRAHDCKIAQGPPPARHRASRAWVERARPASQLACGDEPGAALA